MVTHGATTMWERWNGDQMRDDPSMNSYNHYAYGAVADWMYRYAAGVDTMPADPGFHTVVLHPVFDERLGHLSFDYDSVYGTIHSDWTVGATTEWHATIPAKAGIMAAWHVTLPANTTGWLPLSSMESMGYSFEEAPIDGLKLATIATRGGQRGYFLPSGSYTFMVTIPQ